MVTGKKTIILGIVVFLILATGWFLGRALIQRPDPIKIGILHSLSGIMAGSESQLADATLMAIEEINRQGGLLGRPLQPVVADGRSDWPTFASQAEHLIKREQVKVIFGCYTSASRKNVRAVVEKYNHLLFYPVPYEGVEESPNIVYNGASPNQLYIPAVKWSMDHLGKRFFLVGSDYIWPRIANTIMKDAIFALRGEVVGEDYLLVGSTDVGKMIKKIAEAKPDVILSTIVGNSNGAFYEALSSAGLDSRKIPSMAFAVSEVELTQLDPQKLAGHYSCWSYFQSVDSPVNRAFVQRFRERFGRKRVTNDSIEAGYFGIYLWAQAVKEANSIDVREVRRFLADQSLEAPGGMVYIDGDTQHTWKTVRIAKINPKGQFEIIWTSGKPVRPVPYPIYRSKSAWNQMIEEYYKAWGGAWANPGDQTAHGR
jgi:urea transport system substrate-binding protein